VFLDRDGVINSSFPSYVSQWKDYVLYPWALKSLRKLRQAGAQLFLVTNQSGVGRGYFTIRQLEDLLANLQQRVRSSGGDFAEMFYCPHNPEEQCDCRKPEPGMLKAAASKYHVDLESAWMVGDRAGDIEAGNAVGARTVFVKTGKQSTLEDSAAQPDIICENLLQATDEIIKQWNHRS
jgi:D-glycero-D-manno-heptose 1,7-bisphosphate phosphatase